MKYSQQTLCFKLSLFLSYCHLTKQNCMLDVFIQIKLFLRYYCTFYCSDVLTFGSEDGSIIIKTCFYCRCRNRNTECVGLFGVTFLYIHLNIIHTFTCVTVDPSWSVISYLFRNIFFSNWELMITRFWCHVARKYLPIMKCHRSIVAEIPRKMFSSFKTRRREAVDVWLFGQNFERRIIISGCRRSLRGGCRVAGKKRQETRWRCEPSVSCCRSSGSGSHTDGAICSQSFPPVTPDWWRSPSRKLLRVASC